MLVRHAYSPIALDTESEPLESPLETEEPQPLSPRSAHPSPDYTPATPHMDGESEPFETLETMPTLSPGILAKLTEAIKLSPPSFRKRYRSSYEIPSSSSPALPLWKTYQGTSELIADIENENDESTSDQQIADETPTPKLPVRTIWEDLKEGTIYIDIEWDMPTVCSPIQTPPSIVGIPSSPGWSPEPLSDSPVIPSQEASPVPTTVARYKDQREIHDLRMQHVADQRDLHELKDPVTALEQRMDRIKE
nr:hypothetical protein [Tanacetum cinerariifolium]